MDKLLYNQINSYLVKIFHEVIDLEKKALGISDFSDLTIKEMHTIEAIGIGKPKTSTQVATDLNITLGTLTIAITNLVKKGYVIRNKSIEDKRIVFLSLTKKGELLYRLHEQFHYQMVKETVNGLTDEEIVVLLKGLKNLNVFLFEKLGQLSRLEELN